MISIKMSFCEGQDINMLRRLAILLFSFILFSAVVEAGNPLYKVITVVDGDTVKIRDYRGLTITVNLYGVDAPETGQKGGRNAMKMFDAMIGSKNITLAKKTESGKNVTTARVYLNGISINAAMVKSGHAWVTQASCTKIECENWVIFQQFASTNKKGLWQEIKPLPPWEWRRQHSSALATTERWNEVSETIAYTYSKKRRSRRSKRAYSPPKRQTTQRGRT